jgi:hypothetical protein
LLPILPFLLAVAADTLNTNARVTAAAGRFTIRSFQSLSLAEANTPQAPARIEVKSFDVHWPLLH